MEAKARGRAYALNTLLVVTSLVFAFLLLEVGLRISDYPRREAKLLCLDPIVHNVFCPNVIGSSGDARTPVIINKDGMVDREYPYAKPAGTLRVALLGDSVTASLYTTDGRKFAQLWQAGLSRQLGQPVEVLNFGLDGTGTWEQLQLFHLRARRFSPDYVVLAFYWGNDVWNNEASLSRGRPNPMKDDYAVTGWVTTLKVAHRNAIRWLWNHSAAFQLLDTLKTTLETQWDYRHALPNTDGGATATPGADTGENDPAMHWNSPAWDLTRQLITKLNAEAAAAHARLIVFSIPMLDQITRTRPLPYHEFRAFLQENGIPAIDAFDALGRLSASQKRALYLGDEAHLNDDGHRFFAEAGLPQLASLLSAAPGRTIAGAPR